MAFELYEGNSCEALTAEDFKRRISDFTASIPHSGSRIDHSKENGLVCFDFTKEKLDKLIGKLSDLNDGIRVIPAIRDGRLTVVIVPFKKPESGQTYGEEVFEDNRLMADCCPQPPPPFNKQTRLYRELFSQ